MTTTLAAPAGADATPATAPTTPAQNNRPEAPASASTSPIVDEDAAAPGTPGRLRRLGRALAAPRWRRPLWAGGLILLGKVLVPAVLAPIGGRGAAGIAGDWIAEGALVLAALIALVPIAQKAWRAARAKQMSIDVLVTIATVGALAIGEVWEAAAVTFLFLVGHALEETTLASTRSALDELIASVPATALVVRDGRRVEVPAWAVERGERVVIADGARIPVDRVLLEGAGSVDEAGITGEPFPREVGVGDSVHAGTTARGAFLLEATRVGADTTVAKIVARVEDAQNAKARVQTFMESFSAWYTPAIVVASIVLGILTRDVRLALTLLVISCPGALVISIPVATVAGIGAGAKRGILIRGGDKLEAAAKVDVVALDKTGILTKGRPAVVAVLPAPAVGPSASSSPSSFAIDEDALLGSAAALEASSAHPLAEAVLEAAHAKGIDPATPLATEVESVTGRGLKGLVGGPPRPRRHRSIPRGGGRRPLRLRSGRDRFGHPGPRRGRGRLPGRDPHRR